MSRLLAGALLVVLVAPGCGKRGDPLPPLRLDPRPVSQPSLAQRGDAVELTATAPQASVDGVALETLAVEWLTTERDGPFEAVALAERIPAAAGETVVHTRPLPAPGTVFRAAPRAVSGRRESRLGKLLSLRVQAPVPAPTGLSAALEADAVALDWQVGAELAARLMPTPTPTPDATPSPTPPSDGAASAGTGTTLPGALPAEPAPTPPGPAAPAAVVTARPVPVPPRAGEPSPVPSPPAEAIDPETQAAPEPNAGSGPAAAEPTPSPTPSPPERGVLVYRRAAGGEYRRALNRTPLVQTRYVDTTVSLGATYCYQVRAAVELDPLVESAPSEESCVEVRDVVPPAAPQGVTVLAVEGGLEISWSLSPDAAGYRVYRSTPRGPRRLAELPADRSRFLDEEPPPGAEVVYLVAALDEAGNESPATPTEPVRTR